MIERREERRERPVCLKPVRRQRDEVAEALILHHVTVSVDDRVTAHFDVPFWKKAAGEATFGRPAAVTADDSAGCRSLRRVASAGLDGNSYACI
jgi:hypothetical protein